MIRVYVAGAISASDYLVMMDNLRRGMRLATEALLAGFSPFVPFFDFHFKLMLREGEHLSLENYYAYSMRWLEASEAVLVVEKSEDSKGTKMEIERAEELGIPIFYSLDRLKAWGEWTECMSE